MTGDVKSPELVQSNKWERKIWRAMTVTRRVNIRKKNPLNSPAARTRDSLCGGLQKGVKPPPSLVTLCLVSEDGLSELGSGIHTSCVRLQRCIHLSGVSELRRVVF